MSTSVLDTYRKNWPRVGAVLGMALDGAAAAAARGKVTNLRALSALNWIALLAHLNTHSALCVNTAGTR